MAEKRSIPAALGIVIGPAIAYISFLIFTSGYSEFLQLLCFAFFFVAGHDLAKSRISLSGILTLLLLPAIPIAMYLNLAQVTGEQQLSPVFIIGLWVVSALAGAFMAAYRPAQSGDVRHITRLAILGTVLVLFIVATFVF